MSGPSSLEGDVVEGESPVGRLPVLHEAESKSRVVWDCSPKQVVNPI